MTQKDKEILKENTARTQSLFPYYNPLTAEGSKENRLPFPLSKDTTINLPTPMFNDFPILNTIVKKGGLHKYSPSKNILQQRKETAKDFRINFLYDLQTLRLKYDFEYFCYSQIKIEDKVTGRPVRFMLRAGQRKLLHELEKMRLDNRPIRVILDKARQWGGSTMTQIYMLWIQAFHRSNWNSVIGTDVLQQADTIRAMYEVAVDNTPSHYLTLENDRHVRGAKLLKERNCQIRIGSMQKPKSLRGGTYKMAHFSETALWTTTDRTKPEDLISSIVSAIPLLPYTVVINESTAKGEGNYFHRQWLRAMSGESGFAPVFVAWWEIEIYQLPFKNDEEKIAFYHSMDEYGMFLYSLGATLEGIHWYKDYKRTNSFEDWQMHEEYPSTWQESFIASGERVFRLDYMKTISKGIRKPIFVGDIVGDDRRGENALKNIAFVENSKNGCLSIWDYPDKENNIAYRYLVCMDIGGTSSKADYTVIRVLDRYWRIEDGADEFVLTWRGHLDVDLAVWKAVQIAKIYDNALLVVESNTIDSRYQHTEGEHIYTVLHEIIPYYDNVYLRKEEDTTTGKVTNHYGFATTSKSKTEMINNFTCLLREGDIIEHDVIMEQEVNEFEWKDSKRTGAKDGCHDDVLMSSMIGMLVSSTMPKPFERNKQRDVIDTSSAIRF